MSRYLARRLLAALPTLLGVVVLVFLMRFIAPGDPARLFLGDDASAEAIALLRAEWGLDQPVWQQLALYLGRLMQMDMGISYKTGLPVLEEITTRFPATLEVSIIATAIAAGLGIVLGVLSATRRNRLVDHLTMVGSLIGVSIPVFWLGLLLILVFSVWLGWFPTGGRMGSRLFLTPITGFMTLDGLILGWRDGNWRFLVSAVNHLVLPALVLAVVPLGIITRVTRAAMLEALGQDYIRTARAKGVAEWRVIWVHGLRNALLPVVTIIGITFGYNLAGAVLVENIFAWPGLGNWLYQAVLARDYMAIQGGALFVAAVFILINLLVDVLYAVLNPRIRY